MASSPRTHLLVFALLAGGSSACANWEAKDAASEPDDDDGAAGAAGQRATDTGSGTSAGSCPAEFDPRHAEEKAPRHGFRVVGTEIHDAEGDVVVFRGVNRSGSEYQCTKGAGFFDGDVTERAVRAMARWNINAVRVPLNESCWLSLGNVLESLSGEAYKNAIKTYVRLLETYGLTPILDLHWAAPGDETATDLLAMPNADNSEAFWVDVAETFLADDAVVFEPYNEPFPAGNTDGEAAWACWRDGCVSPKGWRTEETYEAVGMQAMVDAIRSTGSEHLILLGGVQFSNDLSGWLAHKPDDPVDNLAAAWHIYQRNQCSSEDCWDGAPAEVAENYPIVVTELGQNDCQGAFVERLTAWLGARDLGYLAWSWNAYGACVPEPPGGGGNAYSLVTSYDCPMPNGGFADAFYDSLLD